MINLQSIIGVLISFLFPLLILLLRMLYRKKKADRERAKSIRLLCKELRIMLDGSTRGIHTFRLLPAHVSSTVYSSWNDRPGYIIPKFLELQNKFDKVLELDNAINLIYSFKKTVWASNGDMISTSPSHSDITQSQHTYEMCMKALDVCETLAQKILD